MTSAHLSIDPRTRLDLTLAAALEATNARRTSPIAVTGLPESHQLSDQLRHAAQTAGLDSPVGRRLLSVRDDLDSHALAASVLESSGGRNARRLLRRGVDLVAAHLAEVS
jgi:hypothetical protein